MLWHSYKTRETFLSYKNKVISDVQYWKPLEDNLKLVTSLPNIIVYIKSAIAAKVGNISSKQHIPPWQQEQITAQVMTERPNHQTS